MLVAVSRMYEGAHHLSDVLTSLVYASLWLAATALVFLPRHPAEAPAGHHGTGPIDERG